MPIESDTPAGALESYMARSEQLETRLILTANGQFAGGLLLQRVPDRKDPDPDTFNRVTHLGLTVSAQELQHLSAPSLLRRLFPEDDVRIFGGRSLRSACTCTAERVGGMLKTLGRGEVDEIITEQGLIEVTCEFCNRRYCFGPREAARLFEQST